MKVIYYCQHVLGIGHFFRSLEICKAFSGHEVILVTGGSRVSVQLPSHIREMHLPELMMNQEFSILYSPEGGKPVDRIMRERQRLLYTLFAAEAPHQFIVELYPFGRKAFRFEIDPILEGIRCGDLPPCRVICSLRDILVEKKDPAVYEARVIDMLNRYFDALLIHADPRVLTLDETFSRLRDIAVPIVYTGFVTPKPAPDAGASLRRELGIDREDILIVVSAGGGTVGDILLEAVVEAFGSMNIGNTTYLHVFTGPFLGDDAFERLRRIPNGRIRISRQPSNRGFRAVQINIHRSPGSKGEALLHDRAQAPRLQFLIGQNAQNPQLGQPCGAQTLFPILGKGPYQGRNLCGCDIHTGVIAGHAD